MAIDEESCGLRYVGNLTAALTRESVVSADLE